MLIQGWPVPELPDGYELDGPHKSIRSTKEKPRVFFDVICAERDRSVCMIYNDGYVHITNAGESFGHQFPTVAEAHAYVQARCQLNAW